MNGYSGTQGERPYAGAGWYYAEYRPRVSPDFINLLAAKLGWKTTDQILDLGAGPGHLSFLVAPLVAQVVAIEPEPDMLAEGKRRAIALRIQNVRFIAASSDDLGVLCTSLGHFRTALMGRSFHWMTERDRVLKDLSTMIDARGGSVAIISQKSVSVPPVMDEAQQAIRKTLEKYIENVPRGPHPNGRHDKFEDILARSSFKHIERLERVYEISIISTLKAMVGNEYSYSYVLARLGDQREKFEQEVELTVGAKIKEIGEVRVKLRDEALIGRK